MSEIKIYSFYSVILAFSLVVQYEKDQIGLISCISATLIIREKHFTEALISIMLF